MAATVSTSRRAYADAPATVAADRRRASLRSRAVVGRLDVGSARHHRHGRRARRSSCSVSVSCCSALSIVADFRLRDTTASLGLPVTLWASLGCVATATFGNAPLRLALLAVTLLGLNFAALHLGRSRLRLIAVSTWATASLGFVLHIRQGQSANLPDEFLVWSCYSVLLVIALFVADQIARVARRTHRSHRGTGARADARSRHGDARRSNGSVQPPSVDGIPVSPEGAGRSRHARICAVLRRSRPLQTRERPLRPQTG